MDWRIIAKAKGFYNNIEVEIHGETAECYFIYLKDVVCGYVPKENVIINGRKH